MPRFPDEATACLKRTMLARAPLFRFTAEDTAAIVAETGLVAVQVDRWADHFLRRKTEQDRMTFLESNGVRIDKPAKITRGCILGFNFGISDAEKLAKVYGSKVYSIEAVFNDQAGSFEMLIDFRNQAPEYEYKIIGLLEMLGAKQIQVITFPSDKGKTASVALERIISLQKQMGYGSFSFGVPSSNLLAIIKRKYQKPSEKRVGECCQETGSDEFDVVKKRRKMDAAFPSSDDSDAAMQHFTAFESATLPALMLAIDADDRQQRYNELIEMEEDETPRAGGGVYIAFTNSMPNVIKIGATRRVDAFPRLRELSRYVTEAYKLLAWLPASKPFKLEVQLHKHFDAVRIRNQGAGTEFFRMTHDDARIQDAMQALNLSHHRPTGEQRD